jgi:protein Mpv17
VQSTTGKHRSYYVVSFYPMIAQQRKQFKHLKNMLWLRRCYLFHGFVAVTMASFHGPVLQQARTTTCTTLGRDRFSKNDCFCPKVIAQGQSTGLQCWTGRIKTTTTTTTSTTLRIVNALAVMDHIVQSSPYTTAALMCGIKASFADWIAQKRQIRGRLENNPTNTNNDATTTTATSTTGSSKTDQRRNVAFLLYGALYQGVAQEYIYNHLYPLYFGVGRDARVVLMKVAFDLLLQTTLITLPIAYMTKALIYQYSFREAIRRYINDVRNHGLLIKYFSLWGPVQCITFSIIPEHYRITFIAFVSFFWLIILSTISSRIIPTAKKVDAKNDSCELVDGLTCNIDG